MKEKLQGILQTAKEQLAAAKDSRALDEARVKFLGKKGELTALLKGMKDVAAEERPVVGQLINDVRAEIETIIDKQKKLIEQAALEKKLEAETIDVTLPGEDVVIGKKHPLNIVLDEFKEIFLGLGFSIAEGPEVELDHYNFEALNIPKDHPARDTQDTFYISITLARTQTSDAGPHDGKAQAPIHIIAPGRVYRSDAVDATHSPLFHQIEGLVVDKGIRMSDLKGILELFAKKLYGEDTVVRFRPHHFPFTEPSAEMDIQCYRCHGEGCPLCKGEGWIEILGCGMVHPKVLEMSGIDPNEYSGYAFGIGLERMVMGRFKIDDIRLFYENDVRFLHQF
ncbi:MAG: phenylalanine--tRNA ligase subunit alpha [Butyricicoccaceae bacterium]